MAQSKTYLDADGNEIKGTGAYLDDTGSVVGPKPSQTHEASAHIGPTPDDAPVTLGDLIDNPRAALARMVTLTKKGLSDPRNTIPAAIGLAAGATGLMPRSFASTRGMAPEAAAAPVSATTAPRTGLVRATVDAVKQNPDAAIDLMPLGRKVRAGVDLVRAVQKNREPAAPPAAAPAQTPTPVAPAPTVATPTVAAAPAARPPTSAPSVPSEPTPSASVASLDDLALTKAEISQAVKWHDQGVPPKVIIQRIVESRQLTANIGASTPDDAALAISERNRTGKWRD